MTKGHLIPAANTAAEKIAGTGGAKDDAAGDLRAGIARRLSRKVVRLRVYDDGSSDHVVNAESVRINYHERVSAVGEKRRQVSGVMRMRAFARIIVAAGLRIAFSGTRAAFVDVESENSGGARNPGIWKAVYVCDDHDSIFIREELDGTGYVIFIIIAAHMRYCRGGVEK